MATTFAFELNSKPTRYNAYVVMLRITQNRKLKRIKTTVEVKRKSDFNLRANRENWIRSSEPNHKKMNEDLAFELKKAKDVYLELKKDGLATSDKIITTMQVGETSESFIKYAKKRVDEIYQSGGIRNWKKYNGFYNKLIAFQTDKNGNLKDLTFAELTPAFLAKFEAHLHTINNVRQIEKKLHQNTIEGLYRIFRTIVNRAVLIDGLLKHEKNPFLVYNVRKVHTSKEKLNEDEILIIERLELPENSLVWHCRNYFLFSFYCAGIRAGDFVQLRWCNITSEGRLVYSMGKNHKEKDIVLVSQAKEILSKYYTEDVKQTDYIFPLIDQNTPFAHAITQEEKDTLSPQLKEKLTNAISAKNALINKELKLIAKCAKIEKNISFHISRHSFARIAKSRNIDNNSLKVLLAHSNISQTETYMGDFDTSVNDRALESIFSKKESPEVLELINFVRDMAPEEINSMLQVIKNKKREK